MNPTFEILRRLSAPQNDNVQESLNLGYSCMVTQKLDNVIATGKCIDGDDVAFGAFRIMGPIQCIGNAAGAAAFLAVKNNFGVKEIDIAELQALVRKDGVIDI